LGQNQVRDISNPDEPIFIVSKGRWSVPYTIRALEEINVPFRLVIEPQELSEYSKVVDPSQILVLPFQNLGQGSIPARNWIWDFSITEGHRYHWILDDNIAWFARYHQNKKYRLTSGVCFKVVEDLSKRYENVALSGLQYEMFLPATGKFPPVLINTRIYSCILIKNLIPFRWRGRYNEDTDLSLRVLKSGRCTLLIQGFCAKKLTTMTVKGGNTDELYQGDGRLKMAQSLENQHPDCVRVTKKWGRYQHHVNYRPFKRNKLILRKGL
jgi:hypothetical protein